MEKDQAPASQSHTGQQDGQPDSHGGPRVYDSFILRIWRDGLSDVPLRLEVEHIQTRLVVSERDVSLSWILEVLAISLTASHPNSEISGRG